jgi:hypothetical protein
MPLSFHTSRLELEQYCALTRTPFYAIAATTPLLAVYEITALALTPVELGGIRNGADVLLKQFLALLGGADPRLPAALFGLGFLVAWWQYKRIPGRPGLRASYLCGMALESAIYAVFLGASVSFMTRSLLMLPGELGLRAHVVLALGAGIYEEFAFRVLPVAATRLMLIRVLHQPPVRAHLGAALVSAFVFSLFHYLGPYGDPFDLFSFVFRWTAGLVLCGLYLLRGFGVAAYTHDIYDLLVLLGRS